jgi:hypothetical protein
MTQGEFVEVLQAHPGASPRILMNLCMATRSAVKGHINRLRVGGVIARARAGGWRIVDPAGGTFGSDEPAEQVEPDEQFDDRLLEAMRLNPGASPKVLALLLACGVTRIASGFRRLADRGLTTKCGKRWTLATPAAGLVEDEVTLDLDDDPGKWVRAIGTYLRIDTSPFAPARYG